MKNIEPQVWQSELLDGRLVDSYSYWNLSELVSSQIELEMSYLADSRGWKFDWCKLDIDLTLVNVDRQAEDWGEIICEILNKNPKGVKIRCVAGYSPKEYNYSTDSFDFVFDEVGEFEKNYTESLVAEKGLRFAQENEAFGYLQEVAKELLTDDSSDMYWEAIEAIEEWVRENVKCWTWNGVEYDSADDLADDLDAYGRLLADGAEYAELPKPLKKELAGKLLDEKLAEAELRSASWEELANPWEHIEESVVAEHYSGISFVADDFGVER